MQDNNRERDFKPATIKPGWQLNVAIILVTVWTGLFIVIPPPINFGLVVLLGIYVVGSLTQVGPDEIGVITLFGSPVQDVDSGLKLVPLGICQLRKFNRGIYTFTFGQVKDKEGKVVIPEVKPGEIWDPKRELRVTFNQGEQTRNDHLQRRQTTDPLIVVLFAIIKPSEFLKRWQTIPRFYVALHECASASLQEACRKKTASQAIADLPEINKELLHSIERLVGDTDAPTGDDTSKQMLPSGVNVILARIQSLGLSYKVNDAIAQATAKHYEADGIVAIGRGHAAEYRAKAEVAETEAGKLIVQLEALKEGLANGKVVLASGGTGELIKMITQIIETTGAISSSGNKPSAPPTSGKSPKTS